VIIDSSAIVMIILGEPGFEQYLDQIRNASRPRMSAFSLYEAATVLLRKRGEDAVEQMVELVIETGVTVATFGLEDARLATNVYAEFGKGISPVGLNMGDCPVYALAQMHNAPVLSTSDEFVRAGLEAPMRKG
jgi:ribonuclease VapC